MNDFNGNNIIVRGKLITKNLVTLGLTINGIQEQLQKNNIASLKDVQYAEIEIDGSLYIETKSN